jgi:hypothetical protein
MFIISIFISLCVLRSRPLVFLINFHLLKKKKLQLYVGEMVPLELIMWVLEPERLGLAVTGKPFVPFVSAGDARREHIRSQERKAASDSASFSGTPVKEATKSGGGSLFKGSSFSINGLFTSTTKETAAGQQQQDKGTELRQTSGAPKQPFETRSQHDASKQERLNMTIALREQQGKAEVFKRKNLFALYIVDQVHLLTQMCRGRCNNAIRHLEKCFSYTLLLNMASNPWLPYRFRAAVVHLVLVLYVDRYPQVIKRSGICF